MEIEIKKPYSKAPSNTLGGMITETPIFNVEMGNRPHIYMWADLVITNHNPNRRELILNAKLRLKKRHFIFWHKTLVEAPIRIHTKAGVESTGPLLENLVIEPMTAPKTITVDAKENLTIPLSHFHTKVELYMDFNMVGPIRKISRCIGRFMVESKQLTPDKEGSQS